MVNNGKFEVDEKIVQELWMSVMIMERNNVKSKKYNDTQIIKELKSIIEKTVAVDDVRVK